MGAGAGGLVGREGAKTELDHHKVEALRLAFPDKRLTHEPVKMSPYQLPVPIKLPLRDYAVEVDLVRPTSLTEVEQRTFSFVIPADGPRRAMQAGVALAGAVIGASQGQWCYRAGLTTDVIQVSELVPAVHAANQVREASERNLAERGFHGVTDWGGTEWKMHEAVYMIEHARQVSWHPGDDRNENLVVVTNTNRRVVLSLQQWIKREGPAS